MRSLLHLFDVLNVEGAAENARGELVRAESQHATTTALARRIATVDAIAGRAAVSAVAATSTASDAA